MGVAASRVQWTIIPVILLLMLRYQQALTQSCPPRPVVERDEQNSTEIRIRRGETRKVLYKFTYPNDTNYTFFFWNGNMPISECTSDNRIIHTSVTCSGGGPMIQMFHVLIINASDEHNINGTTIRCKYRINSASETEQSCTDDLTVLVYEDSTITTTTATTTTTGAPTTTKRMTVMDFLSGNDTILDILASEEALDILNLELGALIGLVINILSLIFIIITCCGICCCEVSCHDRFIRCR